MGPVCIAFESGGWNRGLLKAKNRGLQNAPKIAVGDGALGFWAAMREVFPETREQGFSDSKHNI
jgi:transposase-like protein